MTGELGLRAASFAAALAALAAWETLAPRRPRAPRLPRWGVNLGLIALNSAAARFCLPVLPVGMAALAADNGWGLFNGVDWPALAEAAAAVLLLDLAIYLQHVWFHGVPWLWRLHRMHHSDVALDVTTGGRFHPLEIILSTAFKLALVAALGASPASVLAFEILLNATSLFNHSNIRLPRGLDAALRRIVVTPDMHLVHHSVPADETNSNFGFNLPWWDRLLGTYREEPRAGLAGAAIGLERFREPESQTWGALLANPIH